LVLAHFVNELCVIIMLMEINRSRYDLNLQLKAIPLQSWTGPEVSRRLRLPDFKTIGT
jgi:hypothetical protein